MTEAHYCIHCSRNFKFKNLYDSHVLTCEFFHKPRRERIREIESFERLPNPQEMYKLIQHLMSETAQLKQEVAKLKISANVRKTRLIVDWLNSPKNPVPEKTFQEWYKSIVVLRTYVEHVYNSDLAEGIKMMINEALTDKTQLLPIRAFTNKPNVIYIYSHKRPEESQGDATLENEWTKEWTAISTADFEKWISYLSRIMLREFCVMQKENMVKIFSNDDEKEKNIVFMMKMNGGKTSDEQRAREIKKWLFTKLEQNIQDCEYI